MRGYLWNAFYVLALAALSPWLVLHNLRRGSFLLHFGQRWFGAVDPPADDRPTLWFHAVSVGEVNLIGPLVNRLRHEGAEYRFAISATTAAGLRLARQQFPEDYVFRCPMDFTWAVRHALKRLQPQAIVLAELELWPNWLAIAREQCVPVAVVNGRLGERSFRGYRRLGPLARSSFAGLHAVAAQDPQSASRFLELGVPVERVFVAGNLKFDNSIDDRENPRTARIRSSVGLRPAVTGVGSANPGGYRQRSTATGTPVPLWVAGSTQQSEEELALDAFLKARIDVPELRLVFVPRQPERFDAVAKAAARAGLEVARLSQAASTDAKQAIAGGWQVLVGDTVGDLRWLWGLADVAFVGGSFGDRGGQNMIEPAAFGSSVAVGPNTKNFSQVMRVLLAADAVAQLQRPEQLSEWVVDQLLHPDKRLAAGDRAAQVARSHRGAIQRTITALAGCGVVCPVPVAEAA